MSTTPTPLRTLVKFEVPKLVDVPKGATEGGQDEEMVTVKWENQRSMKVQFTTTKGGGENTSTLWKLQNLPYGFKNGNGISHQVCPLKEGPGVHFLLLLNI